MMLIRQTDLPELLVVGTIDARAVRLKKRRDDRLKAVEKRASQLAAEIANFRQDVRGGVNFGEPSKDEALNPFEVFDELFSVVKGG
jgi:hypothetical protein